MGKFRLENWLDLKSRMIMIALQNKKMKRRLSIIVKIFHKYSLEIWMLNGRRVKIQKNKVKTKKSSAKWNNFMMFRRRWYFKMALAFSTLTRECNET